MIAPYAVSDDTFGGRIHEQPPESLYTPFELDRLRIVSCTAFRRLEGKTQVFGPHTHDHFRTRMTHTLEVSQIARTLARLLHANETLAEAIALAHDLGHPPFGHAGEAALNEAMSDCCGFNHNTHSLRVVEYLEHPFPPFRGLNLTGETRGGLTAHCTTYDTPAGAASTDRVTGVSVAAQIASLADRIAYNCHDLEDAIGAEFVTPENLSEVELWRQAYEQTKPFHQGKQLHAIRRVVLDELLRRLLDDSAAHSAARLSSFSTPAAVKATADPVVGLPSETERRLQSLEQFLLQRIYRHDAVIAADADGKRIIRDLFAAYLTEPKHLPPRFAARIDEQGTHRVIGDYIAGMTDRFCTREHARLAAE